MKKRNVFLLGMLAVLLAMGRVLAGCDDGNGDPDPNNSGDPNNGSSTLAIRLAVNEDDNYALTEIIIRGVYTTSVSIQYKDSEGNWVSVRDKGFTSKWFKNDTLVYELSGARESFMSFSGPSGYGGDITVNEGDTIKLTVSHPDGRTGSVIPRLVFFD